MLCSLRKSAGEGWAVTIAVSFGLVFSISKLMVVIINIIIVFHICQNICVIVMNNGNESKKTK